MRFALYLLLLISFAGFAYAECSTICEYNDVCYDVGQKIIISGKSYYCDMDEWNWSLTKVSGDDCTSDYECSSGLSCLGGTCNSYYSSFLEDYYNASAMLSGFCDPDQDLFCSNVTVANSTLLPNKTCEAGSSCYKCDSSLFYNDSLKACITGVCDSLPGCSNVSIANASTNNDYCSAGKRCYSCDSDFEWNVTTSTCVLKKCLTTPGCMNITNLTNGVSNLYRSCAVGICWSCKPGYSWNNSSSACVLSVPGGNGGSSWNEVTYASSDFAVGTYKRLSARDRISFTYGGRSYYFGILGIDSSKVNYVIDPVISNQYLFVPESRKHDLDVDGSFDLKVSLSNISQNRANMSLLLISEPYGGSCGNGICETDESASICPADCSISVGVICGDGNCDSSESVSTCPDDCYSDFGDESFCGDDICDESSETSEDCPEDCKSKSLILRHPILFTLIALIFLILLIILIVILVQRSKNKKASSNRPPFNVPSSPTQPGSPSSSVTSSTYKPLDPNALPQRPNVSPNALPQRSNVSPNALPQRSNVSPNALPQRPYN